MSVVIPIYDGSPGAISGSTPFGFYDNESQFQTDGPKLADFCTRRLGYPVVDIEVQSGSIYACFEEAITEYSTQVNYMNIIDNLLTLQGQNTSSNFSQTLLTPSMGPTIRLSEQYGAEAGIGGNATWYTGSLAVKNGVQTYNLLTVSGSSLSGSLARNIEIKRVHHYPQPAITAFYDPLTGPIGQQNFLDSFGWSNYSPAVSYILTPIYDVLLRAQSIEFNDMVRKSAYSFRLINNHLQLFPIPTENYTLWFEYILTSERDDPVQDETSGVISDFSNATFNRIPYSNINHPGKMWIWRYTLALVKEVLGAVRAKYASIPFANGNDVSLDGADLRAEAQQEKEQLIEQLREMLEKTSKKAMLEAKKEEADNLRDTLGHSPLYIYIGNYLLPVIGGCFLW